jgi:hypothetical protein
LTILNKEQHKFRHEVFLDRTHGKRMGAILRGAGFKVHPIYEVYPGTLHETIADPEWINLCAEKNWIVVTGDKKIESVPENRQAVIDSKARVFLLSESNSPPEVWAAAIIIGRYKMDDILEANAGPFFVSVNKRSDAHVGKLRLPPGYEAPEVAAPNDAKDGFKLTAPDQPLLTSGAS